MDAPAALPAGPDGALCRPVPSGPGRVPALAPDGAPFADGANPCPAAEAAAACPAGACARTAYYGLYALQHRGQESCGIAVNNGNWNPIGWYRNSAEL